MDMKHASPNMAQNPPPSLFARADSRLPRSASRRIPAYQPSVPLQPQSTDNNNNNNNTSGISGGSPGFSPSGRTAWRLRTTPSSFSSRQRNVSVGDAGGSANNMSSHSTAFPRNQRPRFDDDFGDHHHERMHDVHVVDPNFQAASAAAAAAAGKPLRSPLSTNPSFRSQQPSEFDEEDTVDDNTNNEENDESYDRASVDDIDRAGDVIVVDSLSAINVIATCPFVESDVVEWVAMAGPTQITLTHTSQLQQQQQQQQQHQNDAKVSGELPSRITLSYVSSRISSLAWHPRSNRDRTILCTTSLNNRVALHTISNIEQPNNSSNQQQQHNDSDMMDSSSSNGIINGIHSSASPSSYGRSKTVLLDVEHEDFINDCCFLNDSTLATVSDDRTVRLSDIQRVIPAGSHSSSRVVHLSSPGVSVRPLSWNPKLLMICELAGTVQIFDIRTPAATTDKFAMSLSHSSFSGSNKTTSSSLFRFIDAEPTPAYESNNEHLIGAVSLHHWHMFDVRKPQGTIASNDCSPSGARHFRWCRTEPGVFAIGSQKEVEFWTASSARPATRYPLSSQSFPSSSSSHRQPSAAAAAAASDATVASGSSLNGMSWHSAQPICFIGGDRKYTKWTWREVYGDSRLIQSKIRSRLPRSP